MRQPQHPWPMTDGAHGVLFFAQLLDEMLNPRSFESFRVYSLDTPARLREADRLVEEVQRTRIPRQAIEPVLKELMWSLEKDDAVRALAKNEAESLIRLCSSTNSRLEELSTHFRFLTKILDSKYKRKIEDLISECFNDPKKRISVRRLAGFYCSHLVNFGYSREFIRSKLDDYFFCKDVKRIGRPTLNKFFSEFDGKAKQYTVHIAVSKDFAKYLKGLNFHVTEPSASILRDRDNKVCNLASPTLSKLVSSSAEELDPYRAGKRIDQLLNATSAFSYLDVYGIDCEWGTIAHVQGRNSGLGTVVARQNIFERRKHPALSVRRHRNITEYANSLLTNFDRESMLRLLRSVRSASLALSAPAGENHIVSLWSAFEALLSNPNGEPRIVHYSRLITPLLTIRHARRQIISVYDELYVIKRRGMIGVLQRHPDFEKLQGPRSFCEILLLQEFSNLRDDLFKKFNDNPLAMHRMWKIANDYSSSKSAEKTLTDHANRVQWQIHRAYRARNELVHAGSLPSYIDSIALNLAEYFRSALATIVIRAQQEKIESSIDQIVGEIGIRETIRINKMQGKDRPFDGKLLDFLWDRF